MQSSLALFDRVFEYLDLPIDIEPGTRELENVRGDVRLEEVWFRYGERRVGALGRRHRDPGRHDDGDRRRDRCRQDDARLPRVAPLRRHAVGASRSTASIVRELTFESLAATVGVVSQETYLFNATVRENLRFAKPDATDEDVEEAARAAQIHALISSLPEGYETVVGERGYRFSGGEKQRMAIARAILRNPPILVLDEATSALDTQTERLVQEALARLVEGRTTIAIAHRLSTIRDADQIVVLDKGRIAERGTYDELVARGGRFAALAARDTDVFGSPEIAEVV